jgi:flagella basal body P-ring formation protein FlgA
VRSVLGAAAAGAALSAGVARAELPERAVAEAVRAHVAEALAIPLHDVEVPSVGLGRPLRCPEGTPVRVEAVPGEDYRGWADLRVGGEGCEALRVRARVQVWRSVPVAAADAGAGAVVRLSARRVLLEEVHGVSVDPDGGPFVAVAPVRAGEPVLVGRVRVAPAARSGAMVQIEVVVGGVVVRVPGKLLSDAALGERVKVLNTVHGVVVEGTLSAPDRVRTSSGG